MRVFLTPIFVLIIALLFSCIETKIPGKKDSIEPTTRLELAPINDSLMKVGLQLFKEKCSQCHTMEYKNTGPDISDILAYRKPEWVVDFLMYKGERIQRDSLALLSGKKSCGAEMTQQHEALEILEYLRIYQIWLHEFNVK